MVALNPAYAPCKSTDTVKNRVGDFFCESTNRVGSNRLSAHWPRLENELTFTITASGRPYFLNADPLGFSGGQNWFAYADGNPISVLDPFGLWGWRNSLSLALDFIPVVGTVKGVAELAFGYDVIAGEDVNRAVAAAGVAASFIPGGKGALKATTRIARATRVSSDLPLNQVTNLRRPALTNELRENVIGKTQRNASDNYVDPNTGRELLDGFQIGHIAGRENRRLLREAEIRGYDQAQTADWINGNPQWFQVEGIQENISHAFELPGNSLAPSRIIGHDALFNLSLSGALSGSFGAVNRIK